jgi:putative transcriptional regulator
MEVTQNRAQGDGPEDRPLTGPDLKRIQRTPQVKIIRRALGLTQEAFSARYRIPLGTLRDWEQGRSEPDQLARAYLRVIAAEPTVTAKALDGRRREETNRHPSHEAAAD